jgi:hypothetical protein
MAIPRRFSLLEESRNGNLPFLEDRGRKNLFLGVLGEFRGMGCYFILLIFQDLMVLLSGIITENTNLWDKNSIMIKKIQIFRGIFFSQFFFVEFFQKILYFLVFLVFSRSSRNFGEDPRIRGVIESIPREARRANRSGTSRNEGRGIPRAIPTCTIKPVVFPANSPQPS